MSFRWKAIGFIASIEGVFSLVFAIFVIGVLQDLIEDQFLRKARITASLFATSTENAVLSTDLAQLESLVAAVMRNLDMVYARVLDDDGVLAERGIDPAIVRRPFVPDRQQF